MGVVNPYDMRHPDEIGVTIVALYDNRHGLAREQIEPAPWAAAVVEEITTGHHVILRLTWRESIRVKLNTAWLSERAIKKAATPHGALKKAGHRATFTLSCVENRADSSSTLKFSTSSPNTMS